MNIKKTTALFAAAMTVWFGETMHCAVPVPQYTVIDLGTLGGNDSIAHGINNSGQVVGESLIIGNLHNHAFLYANGIMKDLGTLGGNESYAYGINDIGQVVGESNFIRDNRGSHAFLYANGIIKDFNTPDALWSVATGINNSGQVVGSWWISGANGYHAFLYTNESMRDIGTLEGDYSSAHGINNTGEVVGWSITRSNSSDFLYSRAFSYSNGSMKNLGALADDYSSANGINSIGDVVGRSVINGGSRAFLYSNGTMKDLGILGGGRTGSNKSEAYGINDSGQVVGYSHFRVSRDLFDFHAFLYSNGSMWDLNNLIDPASGWEITQARAINNVGQIVGYGQNQSGEVRAFLLNPVVLGWKQAIETQPVQPTYSAPPKKENAKDSLVVVTHGWIPKEDGQKLPPDPLWVDEMVEAIRQNLESRGLKNWQIEPYKWKEKAWLATPFGQLLDNADKEGVNLGNSLKTNKWKHIHFIGHSAGAAVIQTASLLIKENNTTTTVHTTFLDAYVGFTYKGRSKYGFKSDWSDSYFAQDPDTFDSLFSRTAGYLDYAYGVDVTWLEPNKKTVSVYRSVNGITGNIPCLYTVTTHGWPHEFYLKTIPPEMAIGAEGFGFPLSKEGGGWDLATKIYPVEVKSSYIKELGQRDSDCIALGESSVPTYSGQKVDLTQVQTVTSTTGIIQNNGNGLIITSGGKLRQQSIRRIKKEVATTSDSVWLSASIIVTNTANFISFDAQFLSVSAEGLFTMYWQTNTVGSIDERVVLPGLQHYTYALPMAVTNNSYTLGFRLDSFSSTVSSVAITNVAFGFIGIREPFSLTVLGIDTNSSPVLSLTGPSGYNYRVESSTNLVDWTTTAVLVNTNGIVSFSDPSSTNTSRRFYRAVTP